MAKETVSQDKKWEIEDAARTLVRAEEIKKDKKLYEAAMKKVKEQAEASMAVVGMKLGDYLDKN